MTGTITLARHGEPALSRRVRLSAPEYRDWWARYEIGGIKAGQGVPPALRDIAKSAGAIVVSTRRRSIESARALAGDRDFIQDEGLVEAPLPPPGFPAWFRMRPRYWGFIARFWWWFFDHNEGGESRAQAQARANAAAARLAGLAAGGEDVLVVAHGFFNTMIGRALKRLGWRCIQDDGWRYWSARRFEAPKAWRGEMSGDVAKPLAPTTAVHTT